MSLIKLLLESNKRVDDIVSFIESKLSLDIDEDPDYEFLGQGSYAKVYSIKSVPDKVIRIEDNVYESYYDYIVGEDLENVVKVYYTHIFESDKFNSVEVTLMEKLEKIPKYERQELQYIGNSYGDFYEIFEESNWQDKSEFEDVIDILLDVEKGIQELKNNDVYLNDLHTGNVMYDPKTEKYKIIDLSNI